MAMMPAGKVRLAVNNKNNMPALQWGLRFQGLPQLHGPIGLINSNLTGVVQDSHTLQLLQQEG